MLSAQECVWPELAQADGPSRAIFQQKNMRVWTNALWSTQLFYLLNLCENSLKSLNIVFSEIGEDFAVYGNTFLFESAHED